METIRRIPAALLAAGTASALTMSLAGPVAAQPITPPIVTVQAAQQDDAPPIMITELAPDHVGVDHFEFVEIHNTTADAISMADDGYSLAYTTNDIGNGEGATHLSLVDADDLVVESGETVVLWLSHEGGNVRSFDYTETDFRDMWAMESDARIVRITGQDGMANGGGRGIQVHRDGDVESWAFYGQGTVSTTQTAEYGLPGADADDVRRMRHLASEPGGTPGIVSPEQLESPDPIVVDDGIRDLMITEIMPDTTGHDNFEYIEVHNTSDSEVTIGDSEYSLTYTFTDGPAAAGDVPLTVEGGDLVLQPDETVVLWLSYTNATVDSYAFTNDDFRAEFDMDDETRIVRVTGQAGMANGGNRGIRVLKDDETDSWAYYPSGSVGMNLSAEFGVPYEGDDPRQLRLVTHQALPSPGTVREDQITVQEPIDQDVTAPPLMVTEIAPDSTSYDNFEYYEIRNTTDKAINVLEDGYSFQYSYVDTDDMTQDLLHPVEEGTEIILEPGETALAWVSYQTSTVDSYAFTEEDFRAEYSMENDAQIFRVEADGMANGGNRGIRVIKDGAIESWSFYPAQSVGPNLSVEFGLPSSDTREPRSMRVHETLAAPSPGIVHPEQLEGADNTEDPTPIPQPSTSAPLIVTEAVVDSTNVGDSDGYEFIEIANATDAPIDFSDYVISYIYPIDEQTNSNAATWPSTPSDPVIQPGETLVFWIKNGPNDHLTAEDFNTFYASDLSVGTELVEISSAGLANGSARGIQIQTNTGHMVNRAYYNMGGARDVEVNLGLQWMVDEEDLLKQILLGSEHPTPGSLAEHQLPDPLVTPPADGADPVITDLTADTITAGEPFKFSFTVTDDVQVKTVTLQLTSSVSDDVRSINLVASGDSYTYELPAADIIGKSWFEYSVIVSDGTNTVTADSIQVPVEGIDLSPVRLNVDDGEWLSGTADIIAATDSPDDVPELTIDGETVETETSLETAHVFAMEVTATDTFFRNGVLAGDEILTIFDEGTYERIETVSTPVPQVHIVDGRLTVSVYAGTKAAPEIDLDENNDDFQIRSLRLILPDGRTLSPEGYEEADGWLRMGDSANTLDFFDAVFTIPDDAFTGQLHAWDTAAVEDGEHSIAAAHGDDSAQAAVMVDNTGPVITVTGVEADVLMQGQFTIDAEATDSGIGIDTVTADLNGKSISLPHATSSIEMEAGDHTLTVVAADLLGNTSTTVLTFEVPEEEPLSADFTPADGAEVPTGDVELSALITDPTDDIVDVTFLGGLPRALDADIRTVSGTAVDAATTERGEPRPLPADEVELFGKKDGLSHDVSSMSQFPYQLFEVDMPADLTDGSRIRVAWDGAADSDAQIILYIQKSDGSGWDEVDRHITGSSTEEFSLSALIDADEYEDDGTVTVLVQHSQGFAGQDHTTRDSAVEVNHEDDLDRSTYDFTLAWESDTQYYNEQYFEHQVAIHDFVLDQRENMNIQYLFHTGDIVDDHDQMYQWEHADPQYARFDEAGFPYGVLAGNHDVGHLAVDFTNFSYFFGEHRFADNPWYGGSYEDNRGHYDLFSAGGIDFIVVSMGWDPGDESIAWMNEVLASHPDRVTFINLHEYMLTTGGLGPIPQRILNEVVATNPNVQVVMSGHYHDAHTRYDSFDDDGDGTNDRTVTSMLFDYQGLPEGGQGFLRLLHFDNDGEQMMVRTFSPLLDQYNSDDPSLLGPADDPNLYQDFTLSYDLLGITPSERVLSTDSFSIEVLTDDEIGTIKDLQTPATASVTWADREEGPHSWYVRTIDEHGAENISPILTFTADDEAETPTDPEEPAPDPTAPSGNTFLLINDWTSSKHDVGFAYGKVGDQVLVGDWDGDGIDTLGVRRGTTVYLKNTLRGGNADITFTFGRAAETVIVGDWDGDGRDTLGIRRGNTFSLYNTLEWGTADAEFTYGRAGDDVLVGDWDGDGFDTITVRRDITVYVNNRHAGGRAESEFRYGRSGDIAFAGDFNGDGRDTVSVRRGHTFHINNALAGGRADMMLTYGRSSDLPIIGDWDGDGIDTPGVNRPN